MCHAYNFAVKVMEFMCTAIQIVCVFTVCSSVVGNQRYEMEYDYSVKRETIERKEKELAGNNLVLNKDEKIVDNYLEFLKWKEFNNTQDNFLPSRPIEDVLEDIKTSDVFRILKTLPKGGNMHLHQNQILDKSKMLDMIFDHAIYEYLCVNITGNAWKLGFYNTTPSGWIKVSSNTVQFSKENILKHITFLNLLDANAKSRPTDSGLRWKEMNPVFELAGTDLVLYENYTRMHLRALFQAALDENVQYLEARLGVPGLYALDDSMPDGHRKLDSQESEGDSWFEVLREELDTFKNSHPEFIGYKDIIQFRRSMNKTQIQKGIGRALRLSKKYPNLVKGVDLVAEEDQGYSLLYFVDEFLNFINDTRGSLPFFFHNTETNWPDDLITSPKLDDPVATLENAYEAILLGSKRVGHGLGIIKHPYLMNQLKERQIAIEVNPVSNMLLGYVPDQRNHPAVTYIKAGVPVVMGTDDPGSMGYNYFTFDWYEAFMSWGIGLKDMKLMALRSLNFSTLTSNEKETGMQKWKDAWNVFISKTKIEACQVNLTEPLPQIHSIFPTGGPIGVDATVRIFGRHFQSAICHDIVCRFGSVSTSGEFVYNTLIKCAAPKEKQTESMVKVSISLTSGQDFIETGFNYTMFKPKTEINHSSPVVVNVVTIILFSIFHTLNMCFGTNSVF